MEAKEVTQKGVKSWMIEPPRYEGKRQRLFFPTEKEANAAIDAYEKEVKRAGEFWARLGPAERKAVEVVCTQVKEAGQTLSGIWEGWKEAQKEKAAVPSVTAPMPYEDCVVEWKRRKLNAGKSERYVYHAGVDLMKFGAGQEQRPIHEITAKELEAWIDAQKIQKRGKDFGKPWGLSTRRTNMALFSSLWRVAIAKDWATVNIVDKLEPIGKISRVKLIYDNETTLNLMAATLENAKTKTYLAPMVLGFFGCMRPEEVTSDKPKRDGLPKEKWFGWHSIDLEHGLVDVSVDVAKTGDERVVRLQPMAVAQVGQMAQAVQAAVEQPVHLAFVDQGYTGEMPAEAAAQEGIHLQVIKHHQAKRGFVLLPRRWVVERSFAWAARFRRLARDYERLSTTLAGYHWLAFVILMLKSLFHKS